MNGDYQLVVDTWEGQAEIDEVTLLEGGVTGMIIRLNDMNGGHHMDENFLNQWAQAEAFCRAPYFVYNPWVDGSKNYQWLGDHMPADAKAVMLDIEVRMSGYSPAVYAAEVQKFYDLVRAKWTTAIYTGEWFLTALSRWPSADYWWAQYPFEFYTAENQVLTWQELRSRLQRYDRPINADCVPGRLRMWQFTGDTLVLPGNKRIMDVNVFYGSRADLEDWLGKPHSQPSPIPDPGGTMQTYLLTVLAAYLNGRYSPGGSVNFPAGATLLTGFHKDDKLEADQVQQVGAGKWYRITRCMRLGSNLPLPVPTWAYAGDTGGYLRLDGVQNPEVGSSTTVVFNWDDNNQLTGVTVDGVQWAKA